MVYRRRAQRRSAAFADSQQVVHGHPPSALLLPNPGETLSQRLGDGVGHGLSGFTGERAGQFVSFLSLDVQRHLVLHGRNESTTLSNRPPLAPWRFCVHSPSGRRAIPPFHFAGGRCHCSRGTTAGWGGSSM